MEIETNYFGKVEVEEEQIVVIIHGLPGFKEYKKFVVLLLEDAPVYRVLQSVEDAGLAFIVVNPYVFFKDYAFDIDEQTKQELDLKEAKDVELYSVMTIRDPFKTSTLNLQAPIVINGKNQHAKQLILNNSDYHTKHSIEVHEEAGGQHAHP
ncbi:flagellar assembly protein FliW [Halobacillus sp. BBL2006]|uniref:flagellar assembly protein FliW n=1 Tax=Halobacillus sp. BBL2006 TaxID=1543706 RepID=UPI000543BB6A|nr:flagellar assembly protein FliW [Halobacillus sp. BBL2006]KHE69120.1 flagellar assembly protein FliW [Halobacillus sp. BBL2006]